MQNNFRFDPIVLEIMMNSLDTIVDQMSTVIARTASSLNIREALDFSTGFATHKGELAAIGSGAPLQAVCMAGGLQSVLHDYNDDFFDGDVFITNDPYRGTGHLPDIAICLPIFVDGEMVAWALTTAHHGDVGGRVPGSNASDSTEIFQEGVRMPPLKLYEKGEPNATLFSILTANTRLPNNLIEDLNAQVSACQVGKKFYLELVEKHGVDQVKRYAEELIDYGERTTRAYIATLPDGVYKFDDYLETNGFEEVPEFSAPIKVKVTVAGDSLIVDLSGSSPQFKGAINCPRSGSQAAAYWAFREVIEYEIPNNGGYFRPITVITEPGTIFDPILPGPVAGAALTLVRLQTSIFGALSQIIPHRTPAAGPDSPNGTTIGGTDENGDPFIFVEFLQVGTGGRPVDDGLESSFILSIISAEVLERDFPLQVEELSYVPNTGGAGKHRGCLSTKRKLRFTGQEAVLQVRTDRRKIMAFGLGGGNVGTPSGLFLDLPDGEHLELKQQDCMTIKGGTVLTTITPGGGGWGGALERDPEKVLQDVMNEKLTCDYVREHYGVIIDQKERKLDLAATEQLRASLRSTHA